MANTKLINTGIEVFGFTDEKTEVLNSGIEINNAEMNDTNLKNSGIEIGDFGEIYFANEKTGIIDVLQNNKGWHQNAAFELKLDPNSNNRLNGLTGFAEQMNWTEFKAFLDANSSEVDYDINQNRIENVAFNLTNSTELTEHLTVKVENIDNCRNPLYLCWLNTLGAWEYWLFTISQKYGVKTENKEVVTKDYTDLSLQNTKEYVLSKEAVGRWTVTAENIDISNKTGFEQLLISMRVNMLLSISPVKWQTVIVDAGSWELYDNDNSTFDVTFDIILPSKNLQC